MTVNNCLGVEVIDLKPVDRDAYILKLKVMTAFNKAFDTAFNVAQADDISFQDILMAPKNAYRKDVYPVLKAAVKHGISPKLKEMLYQYRGMMFEDCAGKDFDDYLDEVGEQMQGMGDNVVVVDFLSVNDISAARCYYCFPFRFMEYCVEVPDGSLPETETILVQNGYAMIVRLVHSLDDIDFVYQAKQGLLRESNGK